MEQARKILTEIPGPASQALLDRRRAALPRGIGFTTPVFARAAEGAIIEDVDGNRLIDFGAGLAVLNVGNADGTVVDAIKRQAELSTHTCIMVRSTLSSSPPKRSSRTPAPKRSRTP